MHNINIMFIPSKKSDYRGQKKRKDISKSFQALASKKFYEIDYIFQEPSQQKHKNIQRKYSFKPTDNKVKTIDNYQSQLKKSELVCKQMPLNMKKQHMNNKQISIFMPARDRTQMIHSRKNPKCHLWRRNSLTSNISMFKQNKKANLINLINPEAAEIAKAFQGRRMSLSMKSQRSSRSQFHEQSNTVRRVFKPVKNAGTPSSPKRKFWTKTYRPWSPQRHILIGDELCATFDQFALISQ